MNRGKYIVIEGPEGVGKTTQLQELARRLQAAGLPVRLLREPDSQSDLTARAIRQLTQDPRYPMNTRTEVLLYNAARSQSLQVIKQSVDHGVICLVDRNYLTTLAIQYYGRGDVPDYQTINAIVSFAVGGVEPDLCVVLDAPVPTLRARLKDRYNGERFDNLDDAFLERVRAGYLWEAKQRNLPVIFATQESSEVANGIWKLVADTLAIRKPNQAATAAAPASLKEIIEQKNLPDVLLTKSSVSPGSPLNDEESVQQEDSVQVVVDEVSYLVAPLFGTVANDDSGTYSHYTPDYFKGDVLQQYHHAMDTLYTTHGMMLNHLVQHLRGSSVASKKERGDAWHIAIKAQANDCLRAILPLATITKVSLATYKDGVNNLITDLLSHESREANELAQNLKDNGHEGIPLMLEDGSVIDGNEAVCKYRQAASEQLDRFSNEHLPDNYAVAPEPVNLVDFWPKNELLLVPDMLYDHSNLSLNRLQDEVNSWPYDQKTSVFKAYIGNRRSPRQRPGKALQKAQYSWDLVTDYASFLDIQTYLTADGLSHQLLSPRNGYDIPQLIEEAGLSTQFEACFDISLRLYSILQQSNYPHEAQYATLMGHKMRWKVTYNAYQAFPLLEAPYDQPAAVALAAKMHEKLSEVHPLMADSLTFVTKTLIS